MRIISRVIKESQTRKREREIKKEKERERESETRDKRKRKVSLAERHKWLMCFLNWHSFFILQPECFCPLDLFGLLAPCCNCQLVLQHRYKERLVPILVPKPTLSVSPVKPT